MDIDKNKGPSRTSLSARSARRLSAFGVGPRPRWEIPAARNHGERNPWSALWGGTEGTPEEALRHRAR
eukprot:1216618-Alexandrium_andersonii.AAC.1